MGDDVGIMTSLELGDVLGVEQYLRTALRGRSLVYEIGLADDARRALPATLRSVLQSRCRGQYVRVAEQYPALLATTLAAEGVFAYSAGDLWSHLDVDGGPAEIGPAFARALERLSLERFPVFDEQGAHRYVSRILAHGGIPAYCLTDLFRLIHHARQRGLTHAQDVLEVLTDESSWGQQIDRPVLRFLRDTGRVGRDFLQRVLELPDEADSSSTDEAVAIRLGLPVHVVAASRQFEPERSTSSIGPRIRRPQLLFDPDTADSPELDLPADAHHLIRWRVLHEHGADIAPVGTTTRPAGDTRIPVAPAARWRVQASMANEETTRSFSISGVAEAHPTLVFDVETGEQASDPRFAPGREVWVVAPCPLTASTDALEVLQTIPVRDESWAGWLAHEVVINAPGELAGMHREQQVRVRLGAEEAVRVRIANRLERVSTPDGRCVLDGPPVMSEIPWRSEDADRWQVTISGPSIGSHVLAPHVDPESVNDDIARIIGECNIADILLRMRGPVGASYQLAALIVRGLQIDLPESPLLPGDTAEVRATAAERVHLLLDGEPCNTVRIDANSPRATLTATDLTGASAELTFRCDAVRWRLRSSAGIPTPFDNVVLRRTFARGQEVQAFLQLDTGQTAADVQLLAPGFEVRPLAHTRSRASSTLVQFDIGPIAASLYTSPTSTLPIEAEVDGHRFKVLELSESVLLILRRISHEGSGAVSILSYELEQTKALTGTCIQVSSMDRPWSTPLQLPVHGSNTKGSLVCPLLRPGHYGAVAGYDAGSGAFQSLGMQHPLDFEVPWPEADAPLPLPDDERELLVEVMHGRTPRLPSISEPIRVSPAAVLLLGSHECRMEAAGRISDLLPLSLPEWIEAFDAASRTYGIGTSAAVRAAVRVLARTGSACTVSPEGGTYASRLLRIAAIRRAHSGDRGAAVRLAEIAGSDNAAALRPEGILGVNAGPAPAYRLREEVRELEHLPSTPLSANGRVLGLMKVRLAAKEQALWIRTLAQAYRAGVDDLSLLPASVRAECHTARLALRRGNFTDGAATLLLHVASFEAAAHVAFGTLKAVAAAEFLASVAKTFPEYVETRVAYHLCH